MWLARRWPITHERFFAWHRGDDPRSGEFRLGAVQFVEVEPELWVANMIGQHRVKSVGASSPVRYEAIREALGRVASFAAERRASEFVQRTIAQNTNAPSSTPATLPRLTVTSNVMGRVMPRSVILSATWCLWRTDTIQTFTIP